jgi:hypothetical protein
MEHPVNAVVKKKESCIFITENDLPAGLVSGQGQILRRKRLGFGSLLGEEVPLVDRSCISLMCYAAATTTSIT